MEGLNCRQPLFSLASGDSKSLYRLRLTKAAFASVRWLTHGFATHRQKAVPTTWLSEPLNMKQPEEDETGRATSATLEASATIYTPAYADQHRSVTAKALRDKAG